MYFKHPNGSYIRVPQIENAGVGLPNGGMTVYYIQPPTNEKVTAFPQVRRAFSVFHLAQCVERMTEDLDVGVPNDHR